MMIKILAMTGILLVSGFAARGEAAAEKKTTKRKTKKKVDVKWFEYGYDNNNNLSRLEDSLGRKIVVNYYKGEINQMVERSKDENGKEQINTIEFKYAAFGRPNILIFNKKEKVEILYDNKTFEYKGTIPAADKNPELFSKVVRALNNLLDVAKPAEVDYEF